MPGLRALVGIAFGIIFSPDGAPIERAKDALFFCSSLLICAGSRTGDAPDETEITSIKVTPGTPVLIGSGLDAANVTHLLKIADGAIVASFFKTDGVWYNRVSKERAQQFMDAVAQVRSAVAPD